ncbi:hypothetical protein BCR43DRAFT_487619 [Syncephalastrum racemosum]|uniref:NAD(P)-binding domain-containing protein n=1 Tax=Syncephalastrum racemosum TaxID=13706 RepID=A0A1X2HHE8_SYNRA|nr:hypothetical protein BCR43DRAFT_487619 [Syncephalastrum racemosum]
MSTETKTALVMGATGAVGKALLKDLLKNGQYQKVVAVGRRTVELDDHIPQDKLEQKTVDFEQLEKSRDAFRGVNDVFCCLGTTRADAGSAEAFKRIDQTYVLESARVVAEENPSPQGGTSSHVHFLYCSSSGANKNSPFLYMKSKGETEEGIKDTGFRQVSIFQPGFLEVEEPRRKPRLGESALGWFFPAINRSLGLHMSIPVGRVGAAMRKAAEGDVPESVKFTTAANGTKVSVIGNKDMDAMFS